MKLKTVITKYKKVKNLKIKKGFVVCGDIHLFNAYPYNDNTSVISSRLLDIASALDKAGKSARKLKLPLIVNGDIIMARIFDYPVEHILTDFLIKYSNLSIFINLGNHDFDGTNSVITPLIKYGNNENHFVISSPSKFSFESSPKINFYFAPFQRKVEALNSLNKLSKNLNEKEFNILFIHNQFVGSKYANKIKSKSGISQSHFIDGKFAKYNMVIASHIHKFQSICGGKGIYTSSLIPLDFGERRKEHGYHIIDIEKYIDYFVIPKAPRFKYLNYNQLEEYDENQLEKKIKNNIICVRANREITLNKKKLTKTLLRLGAKFVTFKTITINKKMKEERIEDSKNLESIVSNYSKIIVKENKELEFKKVEQIGLEILQEAQQTITQKG